MRIIFTKTHYIFGAVSAAAIIVIIVLAVSLANIKDTDTLENTNAHPSVSEKSAVAANTQSVPAADNTTRSFSFSPGSFIQNQSIVDVGGSLSNSTLLLIGNETDARAEIGFKKKFQVFGYRLLFSYLPAFLRYYYEGKPLGDLSAGHQVNYIASCLSMALFILSFAWYICFPFKEPPELQIASVLVDSRTVAKIYCGTGDKRKSFSLNDYHEEYIEAVKTALKEDKLYIIACWAFIIMLGSYLTIMLQNYLGFMEDAKLMVNTQASFFIGPIQVFLMTRDPLDIIHIVLWAIFVAANVFFAVLTLSNDPSIFIGGMMIWDPVERVSFWKEIEMSGYDLCNILQWTVRLSILFSFISVARYIYVATVLYEAPFARLL